MFLGEFAEKIRLLTLESLEINKFITIGRKCFRNRKFGKKHFPCVFTHIPCRLLSFSFDRQIYLIPTHLFDFNAFTFRSDNTILYEYCKNRLMSLSFYVPTFTSENCRYTSLTFLLQKIFKKLFRVTNSYFFPSELFIGKIWFGKIWFCFCCCHCTKRITAGTISTHFL